MRDLWIRTRYAVLSIGYPYCNPTRLYFSAGQQGVEAVAAVSQEVENQLEAFGALVVGVGDVVVAHGHVHKGGHGDNLVLGLGRRSQTAQVALVVGIHGDD